MSSIEEDAKVTTPLGVLGMFGGAMFVVLYVGLAVAIPEGGLFAAAYTFNVVSALPVVGWVAGTVGVYYRHRRSFGWLGTVGTAVLLVGFLASILNSLWYVVTGGPLLPGAAGFAYILTEVLGALLLGAAVARAGELPHATGNGVLLAVALPVSLVLYYAVLEILALTDSAVVGSVLFTLPFGTAWVLLGYDLVTEPDRTGVGSAASSG